MKHTINIFRIFYDKLPPLVPADIVVEMQKALETLEKKSETTLDEVENTMIDFGYKVWPWQKAHREFMGRAQNDMGDHFLLPRLPKDMQEKIKKYRELGMTMDDLHSGRPALEYFSPQERVSLSEALVEARGDLDNYVDHQVSSLEKSAFLKRVEELENMLADIKYKLDHLRTLADKEYDHPNLADEIRSKVRGFEQGLCWLGPDIDSEAVDAAVDFFKGRRHDLGRMRGINIPIEFDYNQ